MKKYLYYRQETIIHARWMTTANGYLRLKMFDIYDLDSNQQQVLDNIVQFIVDVYTPAFCSNFLHPSAVQGPKVIKKIRDFMRAAAESK